MTNDELQRVVETLTAETHALRLAVALLLADRALARGRGKAADDALKMLSDMAHKLLEADVPPAGAGPFATSVHGLAGGRIDKLFADVRGLIDNAR